MINESNLLSSPDPCIVGPAQPHLCSNPPSNHSFINERHPISPLLSSDSSLSILSSTPVLSADGTVDVNQGEDITRPMSPLGLDTIQEFMPSPRPSISGLDEPVSLSESSELDHSVTDHEDWQELSSSSDEEDSPVPNHHLTPHYSAAQWIENHMIEESTCLKCQQPPVPDTPHKFQSLSDITAFLQETGLPDVLHQPMEAPIPPPQDPLWKKVLTGGPDRPTLNMNLSNRSPLPRIQRFDIDAFIAEARSFQALRGMRFSYYPRPMQNAHKPLHIWFHSQRLHRCRHIRFAEGLHDQHLWVHVAFPRMPWKKETYLSGVQHERWIDQVVLPSLREVLPPSMMQHLPPTWAHGAGKVRAKNNEHRSRDVGGFTPIHYAVPGNYLPGLWERMLAKLADPSLAEFRGMFMMLQVYGTKLVWNHERFSALRDDFLHQLQSLVRVEHLNLSKTFVDIGKEYITPDPVHIHWWKRCCLQHWWESMTPENHTRARFYPVNGLRDVAMMTIEPSQKHPMHAQGLVYAQRYNSYKEIIDARTVYPFTNKNIESLLVPTDLLQLWAQAGGSVGRSKQIKNLVVEAGFRSYQRSKSRVDLSLRAAEGHSFGTREEYRVSWELFQQLNLDRSPHQPNHAFPYLSIPTSDAVRFMRWQLNRWLGAFESLHQHNARRTVETGAVGTMLARIIPHVCNDEWDGLPYDFYRDTWVSKSGFQWRGLSLRKTVQDSGMWWLLPSQLDWKTLLFPSNLREEIRFFAPYAKKAYAERQSRVHTLDQLYQQIDRISRFLGSNGPSDRLLERLRRICFLALTIQVLQFDVKSQTEEAPKDLVAYNFGVCYSWLCQYYSGPFTIPQPWRLGTLWKSSPTWADLLQQLFDWDDQHRYKKPFKRDRWDQLEFRLITHHAFNRIEEQLGKRCAIKWKDTLGVSATRFFWMIPKCTPNRLPSRSKRTVQTDTGKKREGSMSCYSAVHIDIINTPDERQVPTKWDWKIQRKWDWKACNIMKQAPQKLFQI